MKKIKLLLLLAALLLLTFATLSLTSCSSGDEGDGFVFDPGANDTYVLAKYEGEAHAVVIPEMHNGKPVVAILSEAFQGNTDLYRVTIPGTVKTIGVGAFQTCISLREVIFAEGLEKIEADAFSGCGRIETLNLPQSLTHIGDRAFRGCARLKSFVPPAGLKVIGNEAFMYCDELEKVVLPDTVTHVHDKAFYKCIGLKYAEVPKNAHVWPMAFGSCPVSPTRRE